MDLVRALGLRSLIFIMRFRIGDDRPPPGPGPPVLRPPGGGGPPGPPGPAGALTTLGAASSLLVESQPAQPSRPADRAAAMNVRIFFCRMESCPPFGTQVVSVERWR